MPASPAPRVTARRARPLLAGLAVALVALPAGAQQSRDDFQWTGRVEPGRVLYVKNLNGAVRVERGGRDVEIVARKRWRRGDPDRVRVELQRVGGGDGDVLVCAFWNDDATCDETSYRHRSDNRDRRNDDGDVSVEFTVRIPAGVRLDLYTVNGALEIEGATAEVRAVTTNGGVRASSLGGPVTARTVNGAIHVRMGDAGREDLRYETVNGSITLEVPRDFDADLTMSTVNGGIRSDFPLTVQGRMSARRIEATIGRGGRRLDAKTVNGSIVLRRID